MITIFAVLTLMQIVAWFRAYKIWITEIQHQSMAGLPSTVTTEIERNVIAVLFLAGITILVCILVLLSLYHVL